MILTKTGFRPPFESILPANDLEIYNVQTDAWGLLALAALLIIVAGWVPLGPLPVAYKRAAVAVDIGHHALTGWGAYGHYVRTTHYNTSMGVGVWGCAGLAALGVLTLIAPAGVSGLREGKKAKTP